MQVALIGLSQSGKTTLFSAVTEGHSQTGAGSAHQAEKAVVKVPDPRLQVLTGMYSPKKTIPATIEFLDLPGLSFADEPSKHDARRIIAQARQADMLVMVLRDFKNDSVATYKNRINPTADLDEIQSELLLTDMESVSNRIEKLEVLVRKPSKTQDQDKRELALMKKGMEKLENLEPLSGIIENADEEKLVKSFGFLTMKPLCVVLNVDEDKLNEPPKLTPEDTGGEIVQLSASIEADIASLDQEDRPEFLQEMGITEIARDKLVASCYSTLKLASFLTVGPDEVRAWTIPAQCPAAEAAGVIHSDIQRGFIRAETVSYDHLIESGDMKAAKAAGHVRLEGKTYAVQDGDIINFRFNV
ncbi:MAG: YchF family ATPase [Phycisphaerae bacterium]|nr:YchF family ATPase [Phycisphaerae bacterium]